MTYNIVRSAPKRCPSLLALLILSTIISLMPTSVFGRNELAPASVSTSMYVGNEAIVGFYGPLALAQNVVNVIAAKYSIAVKDINSYLSAALYDNVSNATLAMLQNDPDVKYAERNFVETTSLVPNDASWSLQWGPPSISAPQAWDIVTGSPDFIVAVVDSGVDYNHPDIAPNYLGGALGGYDWVNNDPDPLDDRGHGTHVAGIIGAVGNNLIGIAGMAWTIRIIAEKVFDNQGNGTVWRFGQAVCHTVIKGAKIINYSGSGTEPSNTRYQAVLFAYNHGCLLVASSGNFPNGDSTIRYPAKYGEVIAVGSIDSGNNLAESSCRGPEQELVAPGVHIFSTMPTYHVTMNDPPYNLLMGSDFMSGTSMAAPHVTGAAALMWIRNPDLTRDELRGFLRNTATDLGTAGWDQLFGYGKVNAHQAVLNSQFRYSISISPTTQTITPGTSVTFTVTVSLVQVPTSMVSLSLDPMYPLNPGLTASWSTQSGNPPFTSTLTITASSTATITTTVHRIRGTSTIVSVSITRYSNFSTLTASAPVGDLIWIKTNSEDNGNVPRTGYLHLSPDIWSVPDPPRLGWTNTLNVRVRNRSGSNTGNVLVKAWFTDWSPIQNILDLPSLGPVTISNIGPYADATVSFSWFLPSTFPTHICVFAQAWRPNLEEFSNQFDIVNNNNIAQKNFEAVNSSSPFTRILNIRNPTNDTIVVRLYAQAPAGWVVDFCVPSELERSVVIALLMIPAGQQKDLRFTIIPPNIDVREDVRIWVNIEGYDYIYPQLGGFTFEVTHRRAVGGFGVPVDKFGLLAPYIGLASTILVATVATTIYVKHLKRRKKK